jgi:CheY-like chemotaxis protein
MTRVLMLDLDARLMAAVTRALQQEDVVVCGVASVDEALEAVQRQAFDAAILDGDLLDPEQLAAFLSVPVVLTTTILEPAGAHRFFSRAPLLRKPFTSAQLLSALHEVCAVPRSAPSRLVDVLRAAHGARRTLSLEVAGARVFMEAGELVHAEFGGRVGEPALAEVLAMSDVRPVELSVRTLERTIRRSFRVLMLELFRHIEEREGHEQLEALEQTAGKGPRA